MGRAGRGSKDEKDSSQLTQGVSPKGSLEIERRGLRKDSAKVFFAGGSLPEKFESMGSKVVSTFQIQPLKKS